MTERQLWPEKQAFYDSAKSKMDLEVAKQLLEEELLFVHGTTISVVNKILQIGLLIDRQYLSLTAVVPENAQNLAEYHWGEPRILEPMCNIIVGMPPEIIDINNQQLLNADQDKKTVYWDVLEQITTRISFKERLANLSDQDRSDYEVKRKSLEEKRNSGFYDDQKNDYFKTSFDEELSWLLKNYHLDVDRIIPPEFIKGYTDQYGKYYANPNYVNSRPDKYTLLQFHQQRINSKLSQLGIDLREVPQKKISKIKFLKEHIHRFFIGMK